MTMASVAARLYEPSTLLEIQALQWRMRLLVPGIAATYGLFAAPSRNFRIRITLRT